MRLVSSPHPPTDRLASSVADCLATILELEPADVPRPEGHPQPWIVWRNWLGGRGMGLVAVEEPGTFQWPGPWIALFADAGKRDAAAAVAFGVPPGLVWDPLAVGAPVAAATGGFVVAPTDPALWRLREDRREAGTGVVESIAVAAEAGDPMRALPDAFARAGRGLDGDRHAAGRGTFFNPHGRGIDLTFIEAESVEALALPSGPIGALDARRNVVTRGIYLDALVGRRFRVGGAECVGQRLCEPCAHLQALTRPGILRALVHRGGLRADVVADGPIRVGDRIEVLA